MDTKNNILNFNVSSQCDEVDTHIGIRDIPIKWCQQSCFIDAIIINLFFLNTPFLKKVKSFNSSDIFHDEMQEICRILRNESQGIIKVDCDFRMLMNDLDKRIELSGGGNSFFVLEALSLYYGFDRYNQYNGYNGYWGIYY